MGLVSEQLTAQTQFDVETLKLVTDDSYMEVSPAGEVDSRDKMLGFYAPEHKRPGPQVSLEEPQVRVYGYTAVVIGKLAYSMALPDGQEKQFSMRGTWVISKIEGSWKIVSAQFTAIR
nr:nuclear transport factor 2 family protein [Pseudoalteromonas caenipelagi]